MAGEEEDVELDFTQPLNEEWLLHLKTGEEGHLGSSVS